MTTTDIHALVGAYALDAVDEFERAAFERHLRECASCRAEADELRATAARLADSAWSVPPPRLRADVLATIATTRQLSPVVREARGFRWRRLAAAAAVVAAVAGASTAVYVAQDQRVRREQLATEAARANESRIRAILSAPDRVVRTKRVEGGGQVTVVSSRLHNAGVIALGAAAAPPDGKIYQLWTIRPGEKALAVGTMAAGESQSVLLLDGLPGATDVGVTIERGPGAVKPAPPMLADVKLV
jgi:anti-sigma-K factor RskA